MDMNISIYNATAEEFIFTEPTTIKATAPPLDVDLSPYTIAFRYIAPFFIFFGIIGNSLSFIVLQGKHFRSAPSSFILSVLAVVDTGVLCTGLMRHWMNGLGLVGLRKRNVPGCLLHVFFTNYLIQLSSWTLVLTTLERMISVVIPLKAREVFNKKKMILLWVVTAVLLAVFNSGYFKTLEQITEIRATGVGNETRVIKHCVTKKEDVFYNTKVLPWLDFIIYSLIPICVISVCNIIIIHKLIKARKERQNKMQVEKDDISKSVTKLLVSVSIVFLLTTIPQAIMFIGEAYWPYETTQEKNKYITAYAVTAMLAYSNNCTNFIMYCLSGSRFRQSLVAMFCCQKDLGGKTSGKYTSRDGVSTTRVTSVSDVTVRATD